MAWGLNRLWREKVEQDSRAVSALNLDKKRGVGMDDRGLPMRAEKRRLGVKVTDKNFFITTAISYPNGRPHIGMLMKLWPRMRLRAITA